MSPCDSNANVKCAVAPAFPIEAQEALKTVASSVPAALEPGQASGPMFEITVSSDTVEQSKREDVIAAIPVARVLPGP